MLETWKSNPAFTMHLKLGLFVLGMASCQVFGHALGKKTVKCSISGQSGQRMRAPNTCFHEVRKKTEFTFAGLNDEKLISSSNNFLYPKGMSKDGVYTTDCTKTKEAGTKFCKLIMSKTGDCSLDGETEFTSILTTKKTETKYCLKVRLWDDRYRYTIEELEDEKCAFEEKESASLTSNAGLRNRRRRLLQDDTGSSGC